MIKIPKEKFYIVGDYHINHSNLVKGTSSWEDKSSCRDFTTLKEMEDLFVENTNKVVPKDGFLIINGDILFGNKDYLPTFLSRINCEWKTLNFGNHDDWLRKRTEFHPLFKGGVQDYLEVAVGKRLVCIFHYSQKIWRDAHHGSYHLFSHSHGSMPFDENSLSIDVGIDLVYENHLQYHPFSFNEIDHIMKNCKGKPVFLDHHNEKTT
mgnify:CR=1 FL=1